MDGIRSNGREATQALRAFRETVARLKRRGKESGVRGLD